jgi:hypothetical protein
MSDGPKYRQRGYKDSERGESGPRNAPPPPKKEGPRGRGLGSPTDTVFRCNSCGEKRPISDGIEPQTLCRSCNAPLHTCSNCIHFDTSVFWECRKRPEIPARVVKKRAANDCPQFTEKTVQEFAQDSGRSAPADARAAFDALFKR